MKKSVLLILLTLVFNMATAQTKGGHLLFEGYPIDGPVSAMEASLSGKGYSSCKVGTGAYYIIGTYEGYENSMVTPLAEKDCMYAVNVCLPIQKTWAALEKQYNALKVKMEAKYGKPVECVERFKTAVPPTTDEQKLVSIAKQECEYTTSYDSPEGNVMISITNVNGSLGISFCVEVLYVDKANYMRLLD